MGGTNGLPDLGCPSVPNPSNLDEDSQSDDAEVRTTARNVLGDRPRDRGGEQTSEDWREKRVEERKGCEVRDDG
jgi:hypothetical protein